MPASGEAKLAWWRDRVRDAQAALDRWRSCPAPGCAQGRYRYSTRRAQWRHLVSKHGASP